MHTSTAVENFPRGLITNQKEVGVKLEKKIGYLWQYDDQKEDFSQFMGHVRFF